MVLENAIWCASPGSLNDKDEFKFELDYEPSPNTAYLLSQVIAQYRTSNNRPPHVSADMVLENETLKGIAAPIVNDVIKQCRNTIGIFDFNKIHLQFQLYNYIPHG